MGRRERQALIPHLDDDSYMSIALWSMITVQSLAELEDWRRELLPKLQNDPEYRRLFKRIYHAMGDYFLEIEFGGDPS